MKKAYKRKIKKVIKKSHFTICMTCLIILLLFMSTSYALLKSNIKVNGNSKIVNNKNSINNKNNNVSITTKINNSWPGNYIVNITLTNNSSSNILSWILRFNDSENITLTSSYATVSNQNQKFKLISLSWNSNIKSSESTTIEVTITTSRTDIQDILDNIEIDSLGGMESDESKVISDGNAKLTLGQLENEIKADINIIEAGTWGGNTNIYEVVLTNNLDSKILGWRGMISYEDDIQFTSAYPCSVTNNSNNIIVSNNSQNDGALTSGDSVKFTLILNTSNKDYIPDYVFAGLLDLS